MLLTLKQSAHHSFKSFHDYSPPTPPSSTRFSPALTNAGPSFPSLPPASKSTPQPMSTPHRGLPPPPGMIPPPSQVPPPLGQPSLTQPVPGQLPPAPQQWHGAEESMRNWLHAKAEEEKRRQEEEKTRQEGLRLEQRKIEHDMLQASIRGGIPPYMIPMVFAGMGGGNLASTSLEWAQHYMAQLQQQQLQQQQQQQAIGLHPHSSPELRRESRQISHLYGPSQHPVPAPLPSTPVGPTGSQPTPSFPPSYPMSPSRRGSQLPGPASLSRLSQSSELPRLNTGEMQIHQPPQGPSGPQILTGQPSHPLQQSQSANPSQQESQPSPSIYFHHWQPPSTQASTSGANQPSTPSDVHASSPRKRKAQGPQQAAPLPSSQAQHVSPPFSHGGSSASGTPTGRRRGHSRQRSDISSRGMESYGRPGSRHRHSESGVSTISGVSPTQQQGFESTTSGETPRNAPHRMSVSERSDTRQSQGSEMRQEDRDSADQESSSRTSSKRGESKD